MKNNLLVPLSIIVAGAAIAGAVYLTSSSSGDVQNGAGDNGADITLAPINEDDHILGSPNADIFIVEYSDTECPFCKDFHETMNRIIDEYGADGKVAWVYRHLPLDQAHPKARTEAEATECAAELGGNDGFWNYINRLFEITPSNNGLNLDVLPDIAEEVGLDRTAFEECLDSGRHADTVQSDVDSARPAGAEGTPYSILIAPDGELFPIPGARKYEALKQIIDTLLEEADSKA